MTFYFSADNQEKCSGHKSGQNNGHEKNNLPIVKHVEVRSADHPFVVNVPGQHVRNSVHKGTLLENNTEL